VEEPCNDRGSIGEVEEEVTHVLQVSLRCRVDKGSVAPTIAFGGLLRLHGFVSHAFLYIHLDGPVDARPSGCDGDEDKGSNHDENLERFV